jgi:16S rRNA (guanine966-N2)-methyltransferase
LSTRQKKSDSTRPQAQKLRIIGGRWRGRILAFPDIDGLRPTGNRVRETLFNWLMPALPGSRCLDLFAGSGALGFEAVSRGAAHSTLVELNSIACQQLRANVDLLQCSDVDVMQESALSYLQNRRSSAVDIVFIDPPFGLDLWQQVVTSLMEFQWLHDQSLIYVEMPRGKFLSVPAEWHLHRQKEAGHVTYCLYRCETKAITNS